MPDSLVAFCFRLKVKGFGLVLGVPNPLATSCSRLLAEESGILGVAEDAV